MEDIIFSEKSLEADTFVGDPKQPDTLPRVKIQKWDNEANFSIGLADTTGYAIMNDADKVTFSKDNKTANFYPTTELPDAPVTNIRRVLAGDELTAISSTSEYELFNQIGVTGQMMLAHYVVTEPSIATFDLIPASQELEVDSEGFVKDFDYSDKSAYHPDDVPIQSYDKVKLVRFYTPYTEFVNPYYMDEGLHNIDIQWHGSDLDPAIVLEALNTAIETKLNGLNIETKRHENRAKLYFKHGDRWVKFFSAQPEFGGLYGYINVFSAYNKAFDFYRPEVEKDVRDQYAYGLQFAYPEVTHDTVNEIMQMFADNLNLPINDDRYTPQETTKWDTIIGLQDNIDWVINAQRIDAGYHRKAPVDGFEVEVIYDSQPASNEVPFTGNIPKNAKAWYQAEKSMSDQIADQHFRPPETQKSIAVYHDSKKDNQYKTGKIAHIYRPLAWDSDGYQVWCDFKETEGYEDAQEVDLSQGLTVVIPQEFLDNAVYPITVDPTLGYSTAGASLATVTNNILGTNQGAPAANGYISSINALVKSGTYSGATASFNSEMAVYTAGTGLGLLSHSAQQTKSASSGGSVTLTNRLPIYYPVSTGSSYIIAAWTSINDNGAYTANISLKYDATGGITSYSLASTYTTDAWASDLTGASTQSNTQYSTYVTYGQQYPIMVGSSVTINVVAARYLPLATTNDTAVAASAGGMDSIAPVAVELSDMSLYFTTTPAALQSRTVQVYKTDGATNPGVTITNPATTGTDTTNVLQLAAGDYVTMGTTGSDTSSVGPIKWRLVQTGTNQIWWGASIGSLSTSADRFMGVEDTAGLTTTAANATQPAPESGTLQNLYVRMNGTLSSGSYLVEIYTGTWGSETASGVKVTLDSSNQSALDSTHTIAVTQGQGMYIRVIPSSPSNARAIQVGIEYVSSTPGNAVTFSSNPANVSNSVTSYNNWGGGGAWDTTRSNVSALADNVNIVGLYVKLAAATGSGKTRTIAIEDNASSTSASVVISDASATTGSWTGNVPITQDHLINIIHTPASSPAASTVKVGVVYNYRHTFIKTVDGLAKANVKTVNGLAIASVKTIIGLP